MLLFRSEEHAERWRERRPQAPAGSVTPAWNILKIEQATALAHAWYRNKLDPDWRRFTTDEAETIFDQLGLDPEFWRLS